MSTQICPLCGEHLPVSAMNVEQGVCLCPSCDALLPLAEISEFAEYNQSKEKILASAPSGCFVKQNRGERGEVIILRASMRSLRTPLFLLTFGVLFNLFFIPPYFSNINEIISLWGEKTTQVISQSAQQSPPIVEGAETATQETLGAKLFLCLFLTPFLFMLWALLGLGLMALLGKVEVVLGNQEGRVSVGIGFLSWKRRFDPLEIRRVKTGLSQVESNDKTLKLIVLEGRKPLKFGLGLSDERREWLQVALKCYLAKHKQAMLGKQGMEEEKSLAGEIYCPQCSNELTTEAINLVQGVTLCPHCQALSPLRKVIAHRQLIALGLAPAPVGCRIERSCSKQGQEIRVIASLKSAKNLLTFLLLTVFWNLFISIFVFLALGSLLTHYWGALPQWFPSPEWDGDGMSPAVAWVVMAFLSIFVLMGLLFFWNVLIALFGKTEVIFCRDFIGVKEGFGGMGKSWRFQAKDIQGIKIKTSKLNDSNQQFLLMEGKKKRKFGKLLLENRREWMQAVVQLLLCLDKDSALRKRVLDQARK